MTDIRVIAAVIVIVALLALGCWICGADIDQDWRDWP